MNCPNNKSRNCCSECGSCRTYVTIQGPLGPMGPEVPRGKQGSRGEQRPMVPRGIKGETGCPEPNPKAKRMIPGRRGRKGATGDKGNTDEQGLKGDKGDTGPHGEKGDTGKTPAITVVEATPLSYKLNFKTSMEDITTPNLFKTLDEYHVDLSATCSTLNIPLENLILTYQNTSTSSIRITVAAKDTTVPILTDMRCVTIYNGISVESQTYNSTFVSTRTILDDLMYTNSQESHSMMIRQQDPVTNLWSLCEIHTFSSNDEARTSV